MSTTSIISQETRKRLYRRHITSWHILPCKVYRVPNTAENYLIEISLGRVFWPTVFLLCVQCAKQHGYYFGEYACVLPLFSCLSVHPLAKPDSLPSQFCCPTLQGWSKKGSSHTTAILLALLRLTI